jgi:GT2 family glycosyltransferase
MDTSVAVVVVTRNRPRDLEVCLRAVLASRFSSFDVVVVDQSTEPTSAELVEQLATRDARVRLVRDPGTGAARARNLGAASTHAQILVFTDDDCEPDRDWLGTIVRQLLDDPETGIAFGSVIPAAHDPQDGFIIGFTPARGALLRGRLAKLRDAGISANLALRRAALEAVGGFDEMLGPGGYFPCAEDYDLTYRFLARGYAIRHVTDATVIHHGLRDWQSGSGLVRRTYIAIGAAYMKHVRLRDGVGVLLLAQEFWLAFGNILDHLTRCQSPFGFGRLVALCVGMWRSFELEVDPQRARFATPGGRCPEVADPVDDWTTETQPSSNVTRVTA